MTLLSHTGLHRPVPVAVAVRVLHAPPEPLPEPPAPLPAPPAPLPAPGPPQPDEGEPEMPPEIIEPSLPGEHAPVRDPRPPVH